MTLMPIDDQRAPKSIHVVFEPNLIFKYIKVFSKFLKCN